MVKAKLIMIAGVLWGILAVVGLADWAQADNGITFGQSTYNQAGQTLIVNSLGDQPAESTHGNLGYNDYVPENAFKNNLSEQGYTQVWDSKPDREDVTAVSYMGLKGDPRSEDVDYVLTSEYNRLNAAKQAEKIESNAGTIMANAFSNSMTNLNQSSHISNNSESIENNSANIEHNSKNIEKNSARLDALEDRNKFKTSIQVEARLYDAKRFTVKSFVKLDTNHESEVGVILTLKFGESYEEKLLRLQNARLEHLEYQMLKMGNR